jgi:catechol 2,3-dioxygenase-like lactoylglutathione lyase family enzyme
MTSTESTPLQSDQFIGSVSIVVQDYDEAIKFFTEKLDFELVCDEVLSPTKRWILVRPPSRSAAPNRCCLLLAKADGENQKASVGNQTGGRVFMFLHTDDFWRDYKRYVEKGVNFIRPPAQQPYGIVAVFEDLCGNKWDLVQMIKER